MNKKKILHLLGGAIVLVILGFGVIIGLEIYETRDLTEEFSYNTLLMNYPSDWEIVGQETINGREATVLAIERPTDKENGTFMLIGKFEEADNKEQLYSSSETIRSQFPQYEVVSKKEGTIGSENAKLTIFKNLIANEEHINAALDIYDEDTSQGYFLLTQSSKESWDRHGETIERVLKRVSTK